MKGVDYSSNRIKSGEKVVPFPIITTDMSEKFNLPTIDVNSFNPYTSASSDSSFPVGLNSDDNPFSDLLLINLK